MTEKLISILMPVKNTEKYLDACLASIIDQSERHWELIIVNDNSTDSSRNILQKFEDQDNRIHVFDSNGQGILPALREAYLRCSGDLIHRMDADDLMPKNKLKMMKEKLIPGAVVTGKVEYFSDDWMVGLGFQNYRDWINTNMTSNNFWLDLFIECPIPSPAWLIHRADFNRIGAFDSDLLPEDYDLCFRIYEGGLNVVRIDKVIHKWRDSQSRTSRKDSRYFPMAYYPLKVNYFLKLFKKRDKELILWGAGKKGKLIAKLLKEREEPFTWVTDNERKQGIEFNGHVWHKVDIDSRKNTQIILAVASPDDKKTIQAALDKVDLINWSDYWWFC